MAVFNDVAKDDALRNFQALNDRDLFRRWQSVGVRLLDELPCDFQLAFAACRREFHDTPAETQEPNLDNWELLGSKLITGNQDTRQFACAVLTESLCALRAAQSARTEPRQPSMLTFSRIAHITECVVTEASAYAKTDPGIDEFFIELESDDAEELERLQRTHYDLLVIALGMSLTEWGAEYPHVDLVQVQFGERNIDIRIRHEN
jgi:hypothetical protein